MGTTATDAVVSFEINPGTLLRFLEARAEGSPRLKCFDKSVTLMSAGMPHGILEARFDTLILAVCLASRIRYSGLGSTTWTLPLGAGDTAYEADAAYYIQHQGRAKPAQHPDLAVEVVVSHPASKALWAGALLKIPELWVLDVPRHRPTFHHLATRGKAKGNYRPQARSRAFPFLSSAEVLERLDDPEDEDNALVEDCRGWAARVLAPRAGAGRGGA